MQSTTTTKSVQLFAGATALLLLCGSAFFLYRASLVKTRARQQGQGQPLDQDLLADVIDDVSLLGDIRYTITKDEDKRKLLDKKYFIDLVALITFHARKEFRDEKKTLLDQRRALYDQINEQAYEEVMCEIL